MTIHIAPSATLVAPMTINFVSVRYSMTTPRLIHKECYKKINGVTECADTAHPHHPNNVDTVRVTVKDQLREVRAEVEGLRLANIGLSKRNRELNKDMKDVLRHWHDHTKSGCPVYRSSWVATLCRFILRHT